MPAIANQPLAPETIGIDPERLRPNPFSLSLYGDPSAEIDDLMPSIREHGVLVPLAVAAPGPEPGTWELLSGHRRLACARALGLAEVPCHVRRMPRGPARRTAVLEYNRQRRKTFSQLMREADALEELWGARADARRLANLRRNPAEPMDDDGPPFPEDHGSGPCGRRTEDSRSRERERAVTPTVRALPLADGRGSVRSDADSPDSSENAECRNSDDRAAAKGHGRTDAAIARHLGMGGKDLYRQARAIWRLARAGDARAQSGVAQLDAGTKTIHAAYKDLRRRDRFGADFRPTPYDVWSFRHDRAFGIPHPGSISPALVAHTLHYYTAPDALVVDPMAGGGTTLDVCQSMGRRCLAYDLHPTRPEIRPHDIRLGFPPDADGCDLIFCDPPYHTMLARSYACDSIATAPLSGWMTFLEDLARQAYRTLRPGGYLALLLAAQTEKDLPAGFGYLDHAFFGYVAARRAGFLPERRISCPMDGAYLPQHVRRARVEGRLLGQVRDLLVMRKPSRIQDDESGTSRTTTPFDLF